MAFKSILFHKIYNLKKLSGIVAHEMMQLQLVRLGKVTFGCLLALLCYLCLALSLSFDGSCHNVRQN